MVDRETHIVDTGGGGAGAIAAIVIVAALIIGFFVLFDDRGGATVDLDVPAVSVDVQPDAQ